MMDDDVLSALFGELNAQGINVQLVSTTIAVVHEENGKAVADAHIGVHGSDLNVYFVKPPGSFMFDLHDSKSIAALIETIKSRLSLGSLREVRGYDAR
jgi:hypothetical protein